MVETTMEIPALLPGQEYLEQRTDSHGEPEFVYAYRSQRGEFFSYVGRSEDDVQNRCLNWLAGKERPYHR